MTTTSQADTHYTSGDYWDQHQNTDASLKAELLFTLLGKMGLAVADGHRGLEVGCGTGTVLQAIGRTLAGKVNSYELLGYDIAEDAIAIANERNHSPDIRFEVAGAPAFERPLDHIYVMDVAEHVENPYEFLRDLHGQAYYVFLHLPLEESWAHWMAGRPERSYGMYRHIHFYSWQSAQVLVRASGYRIVDQQFTAAHPASLQAFGDTRLRLSRWARYLSWRLFGRTAPYLFGGSVLMALKPVVYDKGTPKA